MIGLLLLALPASAFYYTDALIGFCPDNTAFVASGPFFSAPTTKEIKTFHAPEAFTSDTGRCAGQDGVVTGVRVTLEGHTKMSSAMLEEIRAEVARCGAMRTQKIVMKACPDGTFATPGEACQGETPSFDGVDIVRADDYAVVFDAGVVIPAGEVCSVGTGFVSMEDDIMSILLRTESSPAALRASKIAADEHSKALLASFESAAAREKERTRRLPFDCLAGVCLNSVVSEQRNTRVSVAGNEMARDVIVCSGRVAAVEVFFAFAGPKFQFTDIPAFATTSSEDEYVSHLRAISGGLAEAGWLRYDLTNGNSSYEHPERQGGRLLTKHKYGTLLPQAGLSFTLRTEHPNIDELCRARRVQGL